MAALRQHEHEAPDHRPAVESPEQTDGRPVMLSRPARRITAP
ncbi:hypothetical protein GZL_08007 [Streptomyces sp. 769]|nr:hypothetical protein GZL_08007 [Streptomyces sp. 769]